MDTRSVDGTARFFDSRAAYLLFGTTTNEKAVVADRIGRELGGLEASPPGFGVLDAGMGDASVLSGVMRRFHDRSPHVPLRAVAKEISIEDVRVGLTKLPDLIFEHPETVFVVTNLPFAQAAALRSADPRRNRCGARCRWRAPPRIAIWSRSGRSSLSSPRTG